MATSFDETTPDESLIADLDAPGMRPALQARSRKLLVDLFRAGLELLQSVDFDGLAVETLCAHAGSTVGAFYSRFESKDAFVEALQRLVVEGARRRVIADFSSGAAPNDSLAHFNGWIAKGAVVWYRRYEGLIRASLRRTNIGPEIWTPMRELGQIQIAGAVPHVLGLITPAARADAETRIQFAFQMMFGTLNNMVLINPGPFTLHDHATARMLAAAMTQFIDPKTR